MTSTTQAAKEFLTSRRIAVTGVSRTPRGHGGNTIYTRLRDRGFAVFAVNPNADEVEGDSCYHSLADVPGGVEAVVFATRPEAVMSTMQECVDLGITKTWMHHTFGSGSVDDAATKYGRRPGITVIDGGCR